MSIIIESWQVPVERVDSVCSEVETVYGRIAARAYEYFVAGGCINGHDVDDWVRAEQELLLKPAAQLRREDSGFLIQVDLPGADPAHLQVRVNSRQMLVMSLPFESRQIFRIMRFPEPVDATAVHAEFSEEKLRISAPFVAEPVRSLGTVA